MLNQMIALLNHWENHSPFLFAMTVIVVMALEGLFLGTVAGYVFKLLGIRVRKINR
ncbi:MAG TPA: hypothetical protein VGB26_11240 [Nitrospiria bacterium]